ncbi:MAG: GerMN domain-containing protein [Bacilli bacterium]|nr:GerMN domain-containing protein [Bacilli bacterium]
MLKKNALRRICISTFSLFIVLLLCIFPNNETSYPEEIISINELTMPLYIKDQNGYVARTNIIKKKDNDIEYIINLLTKGSLYENYLPVNFEPLIPENTKLLNYSLNDKVLKLNFSKEFLLVNENDEEKMIESLIYSLCELESIDKILIYVENKKLNELPNSKVKLPVSLDKSYGINKVYDIKSFKNVTKTTIYYASKTDDLTYYIPITKITNNDANAVEIIVKELKTSPIYESNLISFLNASYELKNYEIMENSVNMSFDNKMLLNLNDENITEKVKYTLSLSIRDTLGKDVSIKIN